MASVKQEGKKKFHLSESGLAHVLISPALLVILLVAFFPVMKTFYLSLFDMRLNHPIKNSTHLSFNIDVEKYTDFKLRIENPLNRMKNTDDSEIKVMIQTCSTLLGELHEVIFNNSSKKKIFSKARDKIVSFATLQDDSLRFIRLSADDVKKIDLIFLEIEKNLEKFRVVSATESIPKDLQLVNQFLSELPSTIIRPNFIGLENYSYFLTNRRMWQSLLNTSTFVIFAVLFELLFGLMIATLINQQFIGRGLLRAAILIPWSIPAAVNGLIWRSMYDGQFGIISSLLTQVGFIKSSGVILSTGSGAMTGMIVADIWKTTPFMALLILGGLQAIDRELYQAARIDGASRFQQFYKITLPLLKNTIIIAVIFRSLDTFRVFDLVTVLTGGGPGNATETISVYAYKTMFAQMNFGRGSTLSVLVFICISILSIFYIKCLDSEIFEN